MVLDMTSDTATRVRENRLRRLAERQGLALRKSKRRDPRAADHGAFWLVDASTNGNIVGGQFGVDLDVVEEALTRG